MLGGVVEHVVVVGAEDHVLEVGVRLAVHQVVELVDVRLVVLAVVELERLAAEVRGQRVERVGERREGEGHGSTVPTAAADRNVRRGQSAVWNTSNTIQPSVSLYCMRKVVEPPSNAVAAQRRSGRGRRPPRQPMNVHPPPAPGMREQLVERVGGHEVRRAVAVADACRRRTRPPPWCRGRRAPTTRSGPGRSSSAARGRGGGRRGRGGRRGGRGRRRRGGRRRGRGDVVGRRCRRRRRRQEEQREADERGARSAAR